VSDVELAIVMDRSHHIASGVAERYGIPAHTTKEDDVLHSDVDAVLIAVPDRFHATLVEAALSAGKHVLVEKPLASSVDEAEKVVYRANEARLIVQVASMKRHDPGVRFGAAAVANDIGPLLTFTAWYRVPVVRAAESAIFPKIIDDPEVRRVENAAKTSDRAAYVLATHGSHVFDSIRFLAGEVEWIDARHAEQDGDHVWQGQIGLDGQGLGTFQILASAHGEWEEGIDLHGARGTVQIRTHVPFVRRSSNTRVYTDRDRLWREPYYAESDAYRNQLEAFAAAVRGEQAPSPTAYDGLQAVRLIDAAERSAVTQARVLL
jgi:predicted dehydrogenase